MLGFAVHTVAAVPTKTDVSDYARGLNAYIFGLQLKQRKDVDVTNVEVLLGSGGEQPAGSVCTPEAQLEYRLLATLLNQQIEQADYAAAQQTLQQVETLYGPLPAEGQKLKALLAAKRQ